MLALTKKQPMNRMEQSIVLEGIKTGLMRDIYT
jgi:hypothetical protein